MVQVQEMNSYLTTFFLHITLFYVTDLVDIIQRPLCQSEYTM